MKLKALVIRQKILLAIGLFIMLSLLLIAQASSRVIATHSPTTGPVTGPITGPITGPVSVFQISGNVKYHLLGIVRRGAARFMPAANVNVSATDIFNNTTISTQTDASGNYTLDPGRGGLYTVRVSGGETSFYAPPVRFVPLNKPVQKDNANFQGLIFRF
jgi:hypothetical protein